MSRPRVFLVGPPFSGHLHPLLGIGRGLADIADVTVLSTATGVRASAAAGLPAREILAGREPRVWEIAEPGLAVRSHPLRMWRQLRGNVALLADLGRELDTQLAADRPDLVIADFTVPVAGFAAERLGIPWWTTLPSPCVLETPDGPPAYCGGLAPATTWPQRLRHAALRRLTRGFKRTMAALFRSPLRALGLPSVYRKDGSEAVYSPRRILALSAPEIEFPRACPAHVTFTGPVLYTPPHPGPAPEFPAGAGPRVLVSVGTHLPHVKPRLAAAVRAIAARHPALVLHFTHGKAGATVGSPQGNFREYDYLSYAEHLPCYDLVVHHAGTGVLHHTLRHGKPAVVIPQDYDQFDYAARLVHAGLARRARGPEDLEDVLLSALSDGDLRARCAAMAKQLARQDAVARIRGLVLESRASG